MELSIMYVTEKCLPAHEMLARVGEKWTVLVVMSLAEGPMRFSQLRRHIEGISQRMLTLTVRNLERDGIVTRTVTPSIPPRVDYELTPLGQSLRAPIVALSMWAFENHPTIVAARARYDEALAA